MRTRKIAVVVAGALALATAGCGGGGSAAAPGTSSAGSQPASSPAGAASPSTSASGPVKVAFITKFPVAFYTAMEDSAKAYAEKNPGTADISYFSCKSPSDVPCQTAQIQDAVAKGFQAIVITPMGPEVVPAMNAAADKG